MSKLTTILYFILFLLLVIHPHFFASNTFFISSQYAQSFVILTLLAIAYVIYRLHHKDIYKNKRIIKNFSNKLNEAFKHIGRTNRILPLLKNLTTDLLSACDAKTKEKNLIFNRLLQYVVKSIVYAEWGIFRYIEKESQKTLKEFIFIKDDKYLPRIKLSNIEILDISKTKSEDKKLNGFTVFTSSDKNSKRCCVLFFPKGKKISKKDITVLQTITDQAQLFYKYIYC